MANPPVKTVSGPCVHCGTSGGEHLWSGHEHEYPNTTDQEFSFVRCPGCGLVRLDPRPDMSELARIYPSQYYAYNLVSDAPAGALRLTDRMKRRMYQRRLEGLVELVEKPGTIRLLDVGCADGRLLDWYKASATGPRLETHGIEMDESAAAIAARRGHRVVSGRFERDQELDKGTFDLILALHVIEHVDDPDCFAARAAELLAPGGIFFAATP